jgi:hypothetical protein
MPQIMIAINKQQLKEEALEETGGDEVFLMREKLIKASTQGNLAPRGECFYCEKEFSFRELVVHIIDRLNPGQVEGTWLCKRCNLTVQTLANEDAIELWTSVTFH